MGCDALYDARLAIPGKDVVLFDLATWKNGLSFKKIDFSDSGIPVIKIAELNNGIGSSTSFTRGVYSSDVKLQRGDFLFSWSGNPETSIDIFRFELEEGWLNQHIFKTTPNSSLVTRDYFFYLMKWLKPVFKSIASNKQTTGLGHITVSDLKKIKVTVPAKDLQNKVAAILTAIDNKISLNAKLNGYLLELMNAQYRRFFYRNESTFGSIYDIANVIYGAAFKSALFNEERVGHPLIRIRDLSTFSPRYWTNEVHPKRAFVHPGDVLAGMDAEFTPCLWQGEMAVLNQRVCLFEPAVGSGVSRSYLLMALKPLLAFIQNYASGTTVAHMGKGDLEALNVPIPAKGDLERFNAIAEPLREQIVQNSIQSRKLAALRDVLLPKLMSSEIDVSRVYPTQLNSHLA